jgi:tetratricopeptide (TPR) repeat protein
VYWRQKDGRRALSDFDTALKLDPSDYPVLIARAELQLPRLHSGIEPDLDAADRLAPPEAEDRLALAQLYEAIGQYAGAVHQLDLWVDYHPADVELPVALNERCWSEAVANVDVHRSVRDCTRALRLDPHAAAFHDSRGLAWLRLGKPDEAIADYDAALERAPKLADSLYGRGLAELRLGEKARGQADLAAATAASPQVAAWFSRMGLTPPAD